jgi:hypothetical protein
MEREFNKTLVEKAEARIRLERQEDYEESGKGQGKVGPFLN